MTRAPSVELKSFLGDYDKRIQTLFLKTRSIVIKAAPNAHETVWDAVSAVATGFSFTPKWNQGFIHIAAYRAHVNLGFNHGAALHDTKKVLQGSGNKIRHIKIASPTDLKRPEIKAFIRAAITHIKAIGFGPAAGLKPTLSVRTMSGPRRRPTKAAVAPSPKPRRPR